MLPPPDKASDGIAKLLQHVAAGDRDAFNQLYAATSAKLYGIVLRILKRRDLTDEVIQDVYLKIWQIAADYDPDKGSPITWMAAIARNRAIDRLRSGAAMRKSTPIDEAATVIADDAPSPAQALETGDDVRRLNDCLGQLDDKTGGAIRTAFIEGVTYDALALRENVPLGTMKSWIRRGLMRLRMCLES